MGTPQEQEKRPAQLPFSEEAKRVMISAEEKARALNHNRIGTEHILLGLMKNPTIIKTFSKLSRPKIDLKRARGPIQFIVGRGQRPVTEEEVLLTRQSEKVIKFAEQEAIRYSQQEIMPVDLLAGIVREHQGLAAGILLHLKFDESNLYQFRRIYMSLDK